MKNITPKKVVEELAAIGFARATNFCGYRRAN